MLPNVFWIAIMFVAAMMGELITANIVAENTIEEGDCEYMLAVAGDRIMIWLEQTVKSLLLIVAILSGFILGGILHQMVMAVTLVVAIMTTARRSKMAFMLFLIVYLVNAICFLKGVLPRLLPLIGAGLSILFLITPLRLSLDEDFEEDFVEEESSDEFKNSKEEPIKTKSSEKKPPKGGDPKPKLRPRSVSADSDSEATAVAEESDEAESPFVVSISGSVITTIGLVIVLIIILTVAIRILLSLSNI